MTTLLWFRQDLRLEDNPTLQAALRLGEPIIPIYIYSPEEEGEWCPGGASQWWLHHSLLSLKQSLQQRGSDLLIVKGPIVETLARLQVETRANALVFSQRYEPAGQTQTERVLSWAATSGVKAHLLHSALLFEPGSILNQSGKPFQVFTPFWRHCLTMMGQWDTLPVPGTIPAPKVFPEGHPIDSLGLLPRIAWDTAFYSSWKPGEAGAKLALETFLNAVAVDYASDRDRPDKVGTSRLSPHLHFGEISPKAIAMAVQAAIAKEPHVKTGAEKFFAEVGWREFGYHLLFHFPHTTQTPLRPEFLQFPWADNSDHLLAWQKGLTGYPIVDAGMRELWATGWMHNRVRMVVASFLVKHLLLPWQAGAAWFWDTLVDADLASNTLGWQWAGGCGADAAPYFRVFNPILQGLKFDPNGDYVRRWIPELTALPNQYIHTPWEAPPLVLKAAGITLSQHYPEPLVDHSEARARALAAFQSLKALKAGT